MPSKINPELGPGKGIVPVAIWYSTTPNENRSVRASRSCARTCSGDMYAIVPSGLPGLVNPATVVMAGPLSSPLLGRTLANPKSRIFA